MINIELEEYKELLAIKIAKGFEDRIHELEQEKRDIQLNEQYWYDRYREAEGRVEKLSDEIRELKGNMGNTKGEDAA